MARRELPQLREDGLGRQQHLPRRLDPDRRRPRHGRAELLVNQPLPGIELEQRLDLAVLLVDEAASPVEADGRDVEQHDLVPCLARAFGHVLDVLAVLDLLGEGRHVQEVGGRPGREARNELVVEIVELVGVLRQSPGLDPILQPVPLEHRGLVERGRRVGVELEELRRAFAVIDQVEAAIEAGIVPVPALGDPVPVGRGDVQALEIFLVAHRTARPFSAQGDELGGPLLDVVLDLAQGEAVVGALVPVALAVGHGIGEAVFVGERAPVRPLGDGDPLHVIPPWRSWRNCGPSSRNPTATRPGSGWSRHRTNCCRQMSRPRRNSSASHCCSTRNGRCGLC